GVGPTLARGVPAGRVYHLRITGRPTSAAGRDLWSIVAWYTMNRVPERVVEVDPVVLRINELADEERAAGWRLLFDGESLDGWRGFRREDAPDGWRVEEGAIARVGGGGDLITREQFGDFELSLEWKVA